MPSLSRFQLVTDFSLFLIILIGFILLGSTRSTARAIGTPTSPTKAMASSVPSTLKCGSWQVVSSPSPAVSQNGLSGVVADSATDIWSVGTYGDSDHSYTLTEHWDGTGWSVIPSPNLGTYNELAAVTRVPNTNQLWAVGTYNTTQTLIEHWDGAIWNIVSSPNVGLASNDLTGVTATTANNIWAVGEYTNSGTYPSQTLIEHWDGTNWSVVPSPNLGSASWLQGVVKNTANDIWAVGAYHIDSNGADQSLVEHWDGTNWNIVQDPGGNDDILNAVTTVPGTNQLWAVGYDYSYTSQGYTGVPQIEHWNGTTWTTVPYSANLLGYLYGVVAISSNNVWTVGTSINKQTLIEHWNGTNWSIISNPNFGSPSSLRAIARISGTKQVFAVGSYSSSSGNQTLIESNC